MKVITAEQRSQPWFDARRGIPTCSRFDRILTAAQAKPSSAQDALIDDLIAESILPPQDGLLKPTFTSDEMEYGIRLEAEARCCYELEHAKAPVTEVGFILHDSGLFGGSPDALVGGDGGVEIKVPSLAVHVGYVRANELPREYKCQLHGYMVVTGRPHWDFFSYSRHTAPLHLHIKRDEFTAKLEAELLRFCEHYNTVRQRFGLPPIGKSA